ncbi:Bug family tripartite tricarboxylate transporter substrate binding protein [Alcaligenes phenolicus]|uniref:Tripartite tricarboxylate transporter substrate-binding protein n=1 Tax=Alcaligenes phenolicus TaxID=232846 RepID=A0AAW5VXT0_9BURK|nr:tripartite tricarboxylate transporter substrate-binding protein [Alcaligenes phenolicus]MCX5565681.1 tripartite tricarboxylate transporter substrate-binding protein [Alcaligenes phenolicus]
MGLGLGTTALSPVAAETYPSKPLKMYIGFSAGSATDIVGRVVADALGKKLGQPIVVENKVGAGGSLAAQDTARAPSDGYTLLTVSSAIAVNPAVYKNADAVLQELEPVALIGYLPTVLMASDKMPVNNMEEFIKYAKDHPTEVNFGSSGVGGSTHMAMEAFGRIADIKMTHIPFKGNAQASAALLGSQIDAMMETILLATPVINGKRAKGLAISGEQRSSLIPDVPTFAEAGVPEYNRSLFFGVMAPAGISPDLVQKLNTEINAVLQDPAVRERLVQTGGVDVANLSSDEFKGLVKDEVALWKSIAADVGITPQ